MNKSELASRVAKATGLSKDQANNAVTALVNSMMTAVAKGDTVRIPGFGTLGSRTRARRKGINPLTKKAIQIPAKKVPTFKAGSIFKEVVANPGKASSLQTPKPASKKATTKAAAKPKKRAAAKKPAARKPAARKTAARKPAAKRATARKPAARKPAAKRATARKPAARRTTARKKR